MKAHHQRREHVPQRVDHGLGGLAGQMMAGHRLSVTDRAVRQFGRHDYGIRQTVARRSLDDFLSKQDAERIQRQPSYNSVEHGGYLRYSPAPAL